MDEVLLVSDSRALGWTPPRYPGWRIRTVGQPGARLATLTDRASESIRPETRVLVIIALHCDVTYLTDYSAARPRGLMRLLREPPMSDLCNVVTSRDYEWRVHRQLKVFWVLPYTPNFLLYNQRRARLLRLGELGIMYEEEALWSADRMRDDMRRLAIRFRGQGLSVVELAPWVPVLGLDSGSDGVHLGPVMRDRVFGAMLAEVFRQLPHVGLPARVRELTVGERWYRRQRRQRQRRHRRRAGRYTAASAVASIGSTMVRENLAVVLSMAGARVGMGRPAAQSLAYGFTI